MKKPAAAAADAAAAPDLETLITSSSVFFDSLVNLIPSRFYLPTADDDRTPFKFLPKSQKIIVRQTTRENLKSNRRSRLDPATPSDTLHLLHESLKPDADEEDVAVAIDFEGDALPDQNNNNGNDSQVTYEELRQRLHNRIQSLRHTRDPDAPPVKDKSLQREKHKEMKRKRLGLPYSPPENQPKPVTTPTVPTAVKDAKTDEVTDFTFGKVKVGGEDTGGKRKKQKLTKAQELERAERLQELKRDPEKGEKVTKSHSWKAAESRAMGVKVHDDPKLLKESIKKERRRHQKHAEQWKERVESRGKEKMEKQKKRTDNIQERARDKKQRKIEKREKKLLRPGFEGRKAGV